MLHVYIMTWTQILQFHMYQGHIEARGQSADKMTMKLVHAVLGY